MKFVLLAVMLTQVSGSAVVFPDGATCWRTGPAAFACNFLEVRGED